MSNQPAGNRIKTATRNMKKILFTMAVLVGMVAGAMVLSSFSEPRDNVKNESVQITMNDGWNRIGEYYGYDRDGKRSFYSFYIWQKEGTCGAYYWTYAWDVDPDYMKANGSTDRTGELRKNNEGKWYAAYDGTNYFIDF